MGNDPVHREREIEPTDEDGPEHAGANDSENAQGEAQPHEEEGSNPVPVSEGQGISRPGRAASAQESELAQGSQRGPARNIRPAQEQPPSPAFRGRGWSSAFRRSSAPQPPKGGTPPPLLHPTAHLVRLKLGDVLLPGGNVRVPPHAFFVD